MTPSSTSTASLVDVAQASRVEQAVSSAIELVREFSERDPHDGDAENPWKNPQAMLEQLDQARDAIVTAWATKDNNDSGNDTTTTTAQTTPQEDDTNNSNVGGDIRAAYMDMITNAFADVLEDMRNKAGNEEELDVDILVDCLQSGMDFMSGEERDIFMMDDDDTNENKDDDILDPSGPTPHEERRLQLGLHVC